jgi:hypothetical protein
MELDAECLAQTLGAQHVVELAASDDLAGSHEHRVGQRCRDILDVMGDDDEWGSAGLSGEVVECFDHLFTAGQVEP